MTQPLSIEALVELAQALNVPLPPDGLRHSWHRSTGCSSSRASSMRSSPRTSSRRRVSTPLMPELWDLGAAELAPGIAARHFSSVEVTRALLERIERLDDRLRAFITVDAEGALAAARVADKRPSGGSLHGVPIALKDNIQTRGLRTTAGSRVLAQHVPERDAPVVTSLTDAGAIVLGKTNLHEFAYGGTCSNVEFGAVRNPWNTEHVPGGSSGGSGRRSRHLWRLRRSALIPPGRCASRRPNVASSV